MEGFVTFCLRKINLDSNSIPNLHTYKEQHPDIQSSHWNMQPMPTATLHSCV